MKTKQTNKGLFLFLGITLLIQAITALLGGVMMKSLESKTSIEETMIYLTMSIPTVHFSVFLQFITATFIILLGIAFYKATATLNQTMGLIALSLYIFEAILLATGQLMIMGLLKTSELYSTSGNATLTDLADILLTIRHFSEQIAMLPFGIGAVLFYYLIGKAKIIPKWLALWGLISVPLILIVFTLGAFDITLPFVLCVPYVPFEFFTGVYILVKYSRSEHSLQG